MQPVFNTGSILTPLIKVLLSVVALVSNLYENVNMTEISNVDISFSRHREVRGKTEDCPGAARGKGQISW